MKYLLVAAVALLAGILAGATLHLAELRSLRARVQGQQECSGPSAHPITSLFQGRSMVEAAAAPPPREPLPDAPLPDQEPVEAEPLQEDPGQEPPEDPAQSVAVAKEAMELRRTQARAALLEEADPDDAQVQAIDDAVAAMNASLTDIARDLVETVGQGEEPTRREIMGFAADTLDVLITADDAIHGALDPDQLQSASDASVDPFSYVDPAILDLLSEVER